MIIKKNNKTQFCINDYDAYEKFDFSMRNNIKKYNSEIILVTNCISLKNVLLFLFWHLYIIKFEHIVIFDNSDNGILEPYIALFDNKITYIKKPGRISQSECYNEYLSISEAKWVLPIDDDEFLYISDKYNNNINSYLADITQKYDAVKYAVNWRIFYTKDDIASDINDFYINLFQDMFFRKNSLSVTPLNLISCNHIKTIVNTDYPHLYLNDNALNKKNIQIDAISSPANTIVTPIGSVHNPITKVGDKFYHALNTETYTYCIDFYFNDSDYNIKSDIYLAHYHYKPRNEYLAKCKNFKLDNISNIFKEHCYNLETYDRGINFIRQYLIHNEDLITLLNKNKNNNIIKTILNIINNI